MKEREDYFMKVKEFIKLLSKEDGDREVIIQKDPEGNGHSPFSSFWTGAYLADSTWSGDVGLEQLTDEDIEDGYSQEDVIKGIPALILVPVN